MGTTYQHSRASNSQLRLNFGSISIGNEDKANIVVGDGSVDFYFSTETFPLLIDGHVINMIRLYEDGAEMMIVQRVNEDDARILNRGCVVDEASMKTYNMTDFQKTIALLYLIAKVLPNGN